MCNDYLFKVLLIGNSAVSKSSILVRLTVNKPSKKDYHSKIWNSVIWLTKHYRMTFSQKTLCQQFKSTLKSKPSRLIVRQWYQGKSSRLGKKIGESLRNGCD